MKRDSKSVEREALFVKRDVSYEKRVSSLVARCSSSHEIRETRCETRETNDASRCTLHASGATLACLALAGLLAGCASPSKLRSDYGVAIESAKQAQTMRYATDPTGELVRGLDGRAADLIMKRYRQSFEQTQTSVQPPSGTPAEGMSFGGPPVNPVVP